MIQPTPGKRNVERISTATSIAEESARDLAQAKEPLESAELALLHQFFELLAEWDESQERETSCDSRDPILAVDNEIERMQGEREKLTTEPRRKNK